MVECALVLSGARIRGARVGELRLIGIRLRFRVIGLGDRFIGQNMAAMRHIPGMVAIQNPLVPHRSVAAGELILEIATSAVTDATIEVLAVLRIRVKSLALTEPVLVSQIFSGRLHHGLWFVHCHGCGRPLLLVMWLIVVLDLVAQLAALRSICIPGVNACRAGSVVDGATDAFESECGRLLISLIDAPIKDLAITGVGIESIARTFVRPGDASLESCGGDTSGMVCKLIALMLLVSSTMVHDDGRWRGESTKQ